MHPVEIKKNVYWVGVVDWNLRDFHGYQTEKGSTYNAYLAKGENKTALFDTVKVEYFDEFIEHLKKITEPESIDYIIVNHAEMDHSGSLPKMIEAAKPEKIFLTRTCKTALEEHFGDISDWPIEIIKEDDTIELGGKTVHFVQSSMLHWPESMASYLVEDKILISNDIFGQHFATSERFDDEVEDVGELMFQSKKYYANIFLPVSKPVQKFLDKLKQKEWEFDLLAPDHGVIWRQNIARCFEDYNFWAYGETKKKAIVVYDTMWESTAKMARAVAEGLAGDGVSVKVYDLRYNHRSDIVVDLLDTKAVLIGSSVLNSEILPKLADMLTYARGLNPQNKIGASFGSYGWKKGINVKLNEWLESMNIEVIDEGLATKYVPDDEVRSECRSLGEKVKEKILAG